jgi:hypothetical protein
MRCRDTCFFAYAELRPFFVTCVKLTLIRLCNRTKHVKIKQKDAKFCSAELTKLHTIYKTISLTSIVTSISFFRLRQIYWKVLRMHVFHSSLQKKTCSRWLILFFSNSVKVNIPVQLEQAKNLTRWTYIYFGNHKLWFDGINKIVHQHLSEGNILLQFGETSKFWYF